jgi:hemoglobin
MILAVQALVGSGCAAKSHGEKSAPSHTSPTATPATQPHPTTRPAAARTGTLYDRLGGDVVIRKVVDDFFARAATDPAVNFSRQGHPAPWQPTSENVQRLKQHLVQYIATVGDGPTKYQYWGRNMVTAHRGMGITAAEFDALAGHLSAALEANGVPRREREDLLNAVASTRAAIVEVPEQPIVATPTEEVVPDAPAETAPEAAPAPAEAAPAEAAPVTAPGDDVHPNADAEAPAEEPKESSTSESTGSDEPKADGANADPAPATATTSDEYVSEDPEL